MHLWLRGKCKRYLFIWALQGEEHVAHVSWDKNHGRQGHAPAYTLPPLWEHVIFHCKRDHLKGAEEEHTLRQKEQTVSLCFHLRNASRTQRHHKTAYRHNQRGECDPAQLPPNAGLVSNHLLNIAVEFIDTCGRHRIKITGRVIRYCKTMHERFTEDYCRVEVCCMCAPS